MLFSIRNQSIVLSLLIIPPLAAGTYPRGCEVTGFGYNQNYLVLNESGNQSFYLLQNRTDKVIELERHEKSNAFMIPPLQIVLDPGHWSAFASDVKNINFECYQHINETTSIVDCGEVLDVCQYPRARFALSNMGNYWISSNKEQVDVIKEAINKGIYLKW